MLRRVAPFHWAAGDGTSGLRAQRLRSAAMALYESWDRLDASSLRSLRACVHPGGRPVVGADAAMRSWDDLFGGAIRRRAPMSARGARAARLASGGHVDDSPGARGRVAVGAAALGTGRRALIDRAYSWRAHGCVRGRAPPPSLAHGDDAARG